MNVPNNDMFLSETYKDTRNDRVQMSDGSQQYKIASGTMLLPKPLGLMIMVVFVR